jgi:hypothetical protein
MIVLALVVGGITGWYLGVRAGVLSAAISAIGLVVAMFVPGTALPVYAAIILWLGALYVIKTKLPSLIPKKEEPQKGWERELERLKQRAGSAAGWLWKLRK